MTTARVWFGGSGDFTNPDNWTPSGVPQAGEQAIVNAGTVKVSFQDLRQITLDVGAPFETVEPTLDLKDSVAGDINLTNGGVPPDASGAQAIDVSGIVIFTGTIAPSSDLGSATTINLAADSALLNVGTIVSDTGPGLALGLNIEGGHHAAVMNQGLIESDVGLAKIEPAVLGTGTIELLASFAPVPGQVELGGLVGPGQTVLFSGQGQAPSALTLQLDEPRAFFGTIAGFSGTDTIELANTSATSERFHNGVLTVFNGNDVVARLHFTGSFATDQFALSQSSGNTIITLGTSS